MATVAGIDEAGRGPVIGPMVIVGVSIAERDIPKLKELGVKDSKLLTPRQREGLFDKIRALAPQHAILIVPPAEIDACLRSAELNLNWLEALKTAEILNSLKPDTAIIDCPSTNIGAYRAFLSGHLAHKPRLILEHKADTHYEIVGAASILAKVTRDREIAKIQATVKEPLGSGYPADPVTAAFLEKHSEDYPGIFRTEWESWRRAHEKRRQRQKRLADF